MKRPIRTLRTDTYTKVALTVIALCGVLVCLKDAGVDWARYVGAGKPARVMVMNTVDVNVENSLPIDVSVENQFPITVMGDKRFPIDVWIDDKIPIEVTIDDKIPIDVHVANDPLPVSISR